MVQRHSFSQQPGRERGREGLAHRQPNHEEEPWEPLPGERVVYFRGSSLEAQDEPDDDVDLLDALLDEQADDQPELPRGRRVAAEGAAGYRDERALRGHAPRDMRLQRGHGPAESRLKLGADYGLEILAHVAGGAVGVITWGVGAYFTLIALRDLGLPINAQDWFWWAIPVGVSAIEICWWPLRILKEWAEARRRQRLGGAQRHRAAMRSGRRRKIGIAIFTVFALFDILSTFYGFQVWFAGRFFPIGMGWTAPQTGLGVIIPSVVVALSITFVPERILAWATRELAAITVLPLWQRTGGRLVQYIRG